MRLHAWKKHGWKAKKDDPAPDSGDLCTNGEPHKLRPLRRSDRLESMALDRGYALICDTCKGVPETRR